MDILAKGDPWAAMEDSDVHAIDVKSQRGRQALKLHSRIGGEAGAVDLDGSDGLGVEAETSGGLSPGGSPTGGDSVVVVPFDASEAVVSEGADALVGAGAVAHCVPDAYGLVPSGCIVQDRVEGGVVAVDIGDDEEPQGVFGSNSPGADLTVTGGREPLTGSEAF
jgi:hypothetical protein